MERKRGKRWLCAALAAALVCTGTGGVPAREAEAAGSSLPTLTVDLSKTGERDLYHGATGWLYGQGDDQVPTANTITALKPNTAVQKAPNGMQHPNGDVLDIADTFLDAGGKHIQIYVPDYYALWFYEFTGTEYYLDILRMQAQACIEAGIAEDVVYVLYNEPTADWIGGSYTDHDGNTVTGWDSMNWFWLDMVEELREIYQEAGIETEPKTAGLNLAVYDEGVMDNYIRFCAEHDCMPDIVSWHDLATWQYNIFDREYSHYRGLEKKYGVEPREIVINEYAAQSECASPGDLVRWIGLWEDYQVAGCLPFWHFSNNLNGLAADVNEGNGAWWLYKWYGDMSGSYLPVSVTDASQDDFYGAASIDENKKNAEVIFGGRDGEAQIVLEDIGETETFGGDGLVHVKVEATDYTGFHGAAEEPRIVAEGALPVENGTVTVPMSDMNEMSAYHITVTQASEGEAAGLLSGTWKALYEAEDGILTGNATVAEADGSYACSNRKKVHYVDNPGDSVTLEVTAPRDGYYQYDMVYCAATGVNTNDPKNNTPCTAIQNLSVDGVFAEEMVLPSTLHWSMGGMYSTSLYLEQGTHTLKIEATSSQGKAVPDCVYLTYRGKTEESLRFDKTYEAELGEFNENLGTETTLTTQKEGGRGYITGLEKRSVPQGGGVRFNVVVPDNGMYTLSLTCQADSSARANIYLDNDAVNLNRLRTSLSVEATGKAWSRVSESVFLQKGINVIDIDAEGALKLDSIRIRQNEASAPVESLEAEEGILSGEAKTGTNRNVQSFASGNGYVSGIKASGGVELIPQGDPEFTILGLGRQTDPGADVDANSLTLKAVVPKAGTYKMLVYQSNGELFGKHSYNAQMTERYASFRVNAQEPEKVVFRNTYSEETFRPQAVEVELEQGENTIQIYNDNSKVITNGVLKAGQTQHRPENIDYSALVNYTPNFDRFEFYAVTGEAEAQREAYAVSVNSTSGGWVEADREEVEAGGSLRLTFQPEEGFFLTGAMVNGESVLSGLTELGGIYTIREVAEDVEVTAFFAKEETGEIPRETDYEYAVNAGDIDPATLSEGDSFGLRNSVTDQFYGEDPATGARWGVLDTYKADSSHPGWLTGVKTWPCENDGATDASPKTKSFRYARNQAVSDVGVVYQFELEPGETYDLELGFYVPANWTDSNNPRTMKLVLNDELCQQYRNFTASNDSDHPYVIEIPATADENGILKVQIGHGDNAVWGPVVSYLSVYRRPDRSGLADTVKAYGEYLREDYTQQSWEAFAAALEHAEEILSGEDFTNMVPINEADYELRKAAADLKPYVDSRPLREALERWTEYEKTQGQGNTGALEWQEFLDALSNAGFLLEQPRLTARIAADALERLEKAAEKLAAAPEVTALRLEISRKPDKTSYLTGESLDLRGLVVKAVYSDGTSREVTDYQVSGFDSSKPGNIRLRITWQGLSAETSLTVSQSAQPQTPWQPKAAKLKVKAAAYRAIQLRWNRVEGATGYEIYRAASKKGTYRKIRTISNGNTLTFQDKKLKFNQKYFYQIKPFRKNGTTVEYAGESGILTAKTKLAAPSFQAKRKSGGRLVVSYKKVTGATGYQIRYSCRKKSGFRSVLIKKRKAGKYVKSNLAAKKTCYVKMRAYRTVKGKKIYGAWSAVKKVKRK